MGMILKAIIAHSTLINMNKSNLQLIVGLGNPGHQYEETRHNAGVWFTELVAKQYNLTLREEKKFHSHIISFEVNNQKCWLQVPTTFMNLSGKAVAALANFYKIPPEAILIAHDEIDLPVGTTRLKCGGGHGGHNGLRDIHQALGSSDYNRLRIGVGHPGDSKKVHDYVLGKPKTDDRITIDQGLESALQQLPLLLDGEWQKAMTELHSRNQESGARNQ